MTMNKDLITKKELVEIGFFIMSSDEDVFLLRINNCELRYYRVQKAMIHLHLLNKHSDRMMMTFATKANVLKLIEIAKLIGELE